MTLRSRRLARNPEVPGHLRFRIPRGNPTLQLGLLRERQREGITLAQQRGAYRGRKKLLSGEQVLEMNQRLAGGATKAQIARDLGITRETVYQYLGQAA